MNYLYDKIIERIGLIEEIYDIVRIIDPINKSSIVVKANEVNNIKSTCYDFWKRGSACSNCISMRAYNKKDTFIKIEYISGKIFLITATPLYIDEKIYVIEMLKDISINGIIFNSSDNLSIQTIINEVNDKSIIDKVSDDERLPTDDNDSLSNLNYKIKELQEVLNEICVTSEDNINYEKRLEISQYLDELIVKYMKNLKGQSEKDVL